MDMESLEDEQLRIAIEVSLADMNKEKKVDQPLNEFDAQDMAFFTDLALPLNPKIQTQSPKESTVKSGDFSSSNNKPKTTEIPFETLVRVPTPTLAPTMKKKEGGEGTFAAPKEAAKSSVLGKLTNLLGVDIKSGSSSQQPSSNNESSSQSTSHEKELCKACHRPCVNSFFHSFDSVRTSNNDLYHSGCFICGTCRQPIRGQYLQHTGSTYPYHKDCFLCGGCGGQISGTFKDYGEPPLPYHADCYNELYGPRCSLCTDTLQGQHYRHPFFTSEIYCMSHESLPSCFACARKQPLPASHREGFVKLMDGRSLCGECAGSIIVDSSEAVAIYKGIVDFMGRELGFTIPPEMRDVPVLVVDVQSLNENMDRKEGTLGYHDAGESAARGAAGVGTSAGGGGGGGGGVSAGSTVRGVTMSTCCEVQHFPSGAMAYNQLAGAFRTGQAPVLFHTEEVRDVSAVLVLYGLPKDLIASILAHEAMHVWLKLNKDFPFRMPPKLEEGMCQVIAYLYLENLRAFDTEAMLQREKENEKEASLRSYFCKQIRDDLSPIYGDGFREAYRAVQLLGLEVVLEYIQQNQQLPEITF